MKITMEHVLGEDLIRGLYPTYVEAWEPLLVHAAARHVLTFDEFSDEMTDSRIEKHIVWGDEGRQILALTTLTTDVAAIPWINPTYYEARYPDAAARGSVFYLGYTLVDAHHRRSTALLLMADAVNRRVEGARGVVGFDICEFNNKHGIGRRVARLFSRSDGIETLDAQHYYVADYRGTSAVRGHRYGTTTPRAQAVSENADYRVVTLAERPDLAAEIPELLASRWPTFMLAGHPGHEVDLEELLLSIPDKQVLLVSESGGLVGSGLSVPVRWDGTAAGLPKGWDDAIAQSADLIERGELAQAVCALSITLSAEASGRSLSRRMLEAMNRVAAASGAEALIGPVRPSRKAEYPLISMEEFLRWQNSRGEPFDPWLRLHTRLGGEILGIASASMTITGTAKEWETWLGVELPSSGEYLLPGGLAPLRLDVEADLGTYREPNVWVAHRLTPRTAFA